MSANHHRRVHSLKGTIAYDTTKKKPTTAITTPRKQSVNIKGNIGNEEQPHFTTYEQGASEIVDTIYLKENK
jgi:hypothetical protein